jgi:hypothetical protein
LVKKMIPWEAQMASKDQPTVDFGWVSRLGLESAKTFWGKNVIPALAEDLAVFSCEPAPKKKSITVYACGAEVGAEMAEGFGRVGERSSGDGEDVVAVLA